MAFNTINSNPYYDKYFSAFINHYGMITAQIILYFCDQSTSPCRRKFTYGFY